MTKREELARLVAFYFSGLEADAVHADYEVVDAILDALMEPGEGALETGTPWAEGHYCENCKGVGGGDAENMWRAILTHIREGKS